MAPQGSLGRSPIRHAVGFALDRPGVVISDRFARASLRRADAWALTGSPFAQVLGHGAGFLAAWRHLNRI